MPSPSGSSAQTVLVQVPAWKQSQAALALAQLHLDNGAPQAAQHALSMLQQPTEGPDGLPQQQDAHQAQALYQHADLLLQLDQQVHLMHAELHGSDWLARVKAAGECCYA